MLFRSVDSCLATPVAWVSGLWTQYTEQRCQLMSWKAVRQDTEDSLHPQLEQHLRGSLVIVEAGTALPTMLNLVIVKHQW